MRGKLLYKLTAYNYDRFLREYQYYKRGVREQILNLNLRQKRDLIAFLDMNLRPENAEYKYDFFFDNCSSRIRDVFEKTLAPDTNYLSDKKLTFRDQLHQYQVSHPWTKLGIDMIIGSVADKMATPRHQMFLPDYLHDVLAKVKMNNANLLQPSLGVLYFIDEKEIRNEQPFIRPFTLNVFLLFSTIVLLLIYKTNWINHLARTWYFVAGMGGIIIIFLWFFTDHLATKANWNLLWLNPLFFVMLIKDSKWRIRVKYLLTFTSVIALLNSILGIIPQQMPYFSCIVPAFIWFILTEWFNFKNKNHMPTK